MDQTCGAVHPALDVTCELPPGPNAWADGIERFDEETGGAFGYDVHIHKGRDQVGDTYRWESP